MPPEDVIIWNRLHSLIHRTRPIPTTRDDILLCIGFVLGSDVVYGNLSRIHALKMLTLTAKTPTDKLTTLWDELPFNTSSIGRG